MLCSGTQHSTHYRSSACTATNASNSISAAVSSADAASSKSSSCKSTGKYNKIRCSISQNRRPLCSFIPNQREGIMNSSQFFSELMILRVHSLLPFYFSFSFVSDFTLSTLVLFLLLHFTFRKHTLSPFLLSLSQTQTTPKIGSDIIPDIFIWHQNTFTFKKPVPLGAKIL